MADTNMPDIDDLTHLMGNTEVDPAGPAGQVNRLAEQLAGATIKDVEMQDDDNDEGEEVQEQALTLRELEDIEFPDHGASLTVQPAKPRYTWTDVSISSSMNSYLSAFPTPENPPSPLDCFRGPSYSPTSQITNTYNPLAPLPNPPPIPIPGRPNPYAPLQPSEVKILHPEFFTPSATGHKLKSYNLPIYTTTDLLTLGTVLNTHIHSRYKSGDKRPPLLPPPNHPYYPFWLSGAPAPPEPPHYQYQITYNSPAPHPLVDESSPLIATYLTHPSRFPKYPPEPKYSPLPPFKERYAHFFNQQGEMLKNAILPLEEWEVEKLSEMVMEEAGRKWEEAEKEGKVRGITWCVIGFRFRRGDMGCFRFGWRGMC